MRSFPKMELIHSIKIYDNIKIETLEISDDKKCIYVWGKGDEIITIYENIISDFQTIEFSK